MAFYLAKVKGLAVRMIAIIIVFTCGVNTSSCPAKTDVGNCSCVFLKSNSEGSSFSKQEILAGVAGVLSPMLVGGSAFGIWKYIQFKKQGPKFDRAPSDLTDDSNEGSSSRDRKSFNKNRKVTPSHERYDSDTDTYARPYSNPLSLSGDSEYGFDDTPRDTPSGLSDIEQDSNQGRWGSSPSSRPSQKMPTASSGGLNNWMF